MEKQETAAKKVVPMAPGSGFMDSTKEAEN